MLITRAVWKIKPGGMIGRQPIWVSKIVQAGPESSLFVRLLACAPGFDSPGAEWFDSNED